MFKPRKILIIGGNAAGPAAAAKAKRINPQAEVIMFEKGPHISTGTCELPYVLGGEISSSEEVVFFNESSFESAKGVKVYCNSFVESINKNQNKISVRNLLSDTTKQFEYDSLILCTGSVANGCPGLPQNSKNVISLKSVTDLNYLKKYLVKSQVKTVAIIGSGYIGIETAEAFSKIGIPVKLFEISARPMPKAEPEVSALIFEELHRNNVEFFGDQTKIQFIEKNEIITSIKIDSRFIEVDFVLCATGFSPNNALAKTINLNLGKEGGLLVDSKLKTNQNKIYAAGDCIEIKDFITLKNHLLPLATIAHRSGHVAGENAAGGNRHFKPVIKNISVKIFDSVFSQVGLSESEALEHGFAYNSVSAVANNLVHVMPNSSKVFGKLIYKRESFEILGATFFGKNEVIGYADIIAAMIYNKDSAKKLAEYEFNYTPPLSPFINLLSILGRKIN
ncbi:MAG: FAD-dependent oxidoreductase [Melioribacteraceae bacterium]|nr:FAD-dependent oxidoreductase [Melioribacteraceae bacterium]MCF8263811.1 FAD-dependent oxidoreductase [Melioribacteraceae bacterium]